jgi:hypothetical protein
MSYRHYKGREYPDAPRSAGRTRGRRGSHEHPRSCVEAPTWTAIQQLIAGAKAHYPELLAGAKEMGFNL